MYSKLTLVQTYALWSYLYSENLVNSPPDPSQCSGELLGKECDQLSHAEVILAIADKKDIIWCDILCCLLEKPLYLCARGETGVPLTDIAGRPLPLPIGHRRGQGPGSGDIPRRIAKRVQYQRKFDPRVIVKIVDKNPKTPNTKSYFRFQIYKIGMNVNEYVALGGTHGDIVHDVEKGYIVIDNP